MKKVLAVVAVVCVVCAAGAALAQPRAREDVRKMPSQAVQGQPGQPMNQRNNQQFAGEPCRCGRGFDRRPEDGKGNFDPQGMPGEFGGHGHKDGFGRGCGRMMFAPDMPEEIKAKVVEAAKLKIDLEAALSAKPIDKAKALEVFTKIQKTEQEIEAWKFIKHIEQMEAFRTQKELNRKVPPAPAPAPAPKPAEKPIAPAAPAE